MASAKRGDWDAAYGLLAKDMTVHIPGKSAFAGGEWTEGYVYTDKLTVQ